MFRIRLISGDGCEKEFDSKDRPDIITTPVLLADRTVMFNGNEFVDAPVKVNTLKRDYMFFDTMNRIHIYKEVHTL